MQLAVRSQGRQGAQALPRARVRGVARRGKFSAGVIRGEAGSQLERQGVEVLQVWGAGKPGAQGAAWPVEPPCAQG